MMNKDANYQKVLDNDELKSINKSISSSILKGFNEEMQEELMAMMQLPNNKDDLVATIIDYLVESSEKLRYYSTYCTMFIVLRMLTLQHVHRCIEKFRAEYISLWRPNIFREMEVFYANEFANHESDRLDRGFIQAMHETGKELLYGKTITLSEDDKDIIAKSPFDEQEFITLHFGIFFIKGYREIFFPLIKKP